MSTVTYELIHIFFAIGPHPLQINESWAKRPQGGVRREKEGPAVRRTVRKRGSAEDEGVKSVREDIAAFDAIDGEHVEAGGREVVAVIDQVPIGAQCGVSLPKPHAGAAL